MWVTDFSFSFFCFQFIYKVWHFFFVVYYGMLPHKVIPSLSATRMDATFSGRILQQTVFSASSPKAYSRHARAASVP